MLRIQRMASVMKHYAKQHDLDPATLHYTYDGAELNPKDTVQSLGLKQDSLICVTQRGFKRKMDAIENAPLDE